jgi:hypothetical protein
MRQAHKDVGVNSIPFSLSLADARSSDGLPPEDTQSVGIPPRPLNGEGRRIVDWHTCLVMDWRCSATHIRPVTACFCIVECLRDVALHRNRPWKGLSQIVCKLCAFSVAQWPLPSAVLWDVGHAEL